mgnify:CR=1 FL=1
MILIFSRLWQAVYSLKITLTSSQNALTPGIIIPPHGGGEVGFAEKNPPHGRKAGGEVFPPMGERLGGKFSKLPPHHGGEVGWGGSFP